MLCYFSWARCTVVTLAGCFCQIEKRVDCHMLEKQRGRCKGVSPGNIKVRGKLMQ